MKDVLKLVEFKAEGTHPFKSGLYTSHEKFKELIIKSQARKYFYKQLKDRLKASSENNSNCEMHLIPFSEDMINNMEIQVFFSHGKVHVEVTGVSVEMFAKGESALGHVRTETKDPKRPHYLGSQPIDRELATVTIGSIGIKEVEVDSNPCLIRV